MAQPKPSLIDEMVGSRIRTRRLALGLSQADLGDALGETSQEVQEYEHGTGRVGAGQLIQIASALEVELEYFFEGDAPEPDDDPASACDGKRTSALAGMRTSRAEQDSDKVSGFIASAEGLELIKAFIRIGDPDLRQYIVALVKKISPGIRSL